MEEAATALGKLESTSKVKSKALKTLEEGMKLMDERQKHVRMADRSKYGWVTVDEYVEDELADNEDDKKRMFKAEARVGRKLKSVKNEKCQWVKVPKSRA